MGPKNGKDVNTQTKKGTVYKDEIHQRGHPNLSLTFDRQSVSPSVDIQRWVEDTEKTLRSGDYIGDTTLGDMTFDNALDQYELEVSSKKRRCQ